MQLEENPPRLRGDIMNADEMYFFKGEKWTLFKTDSFLMFPPNSGRTNAVPTPNAALPSSSTRNRPR